MRIVHEVEGEAQVTGGGSPYLHPPGTKATGFRGDVLIAVEGNGTYVVDEAIHIEGDGLHLLNALREAVRVLESCAEIHVERGDLDPAWESLSVAKTA